MLVPGGSGAKDYEQLSAWFASDAPKHFHDAKAAIKALGTAGFVVNGIAGDARIMGWLAQPGKQGQPLADLVYQELGEELPTADPNQLVPETDPVNVGVHAWFVLRVTTALRARIDASSLQVLDDIELPLVSVLAGMETIGVGIDRPVLTGLSKELGERAAELAQQAFAEIGHEVNLGSPKQLQEVLFTELAMPKTRKTKTGFSTDAASLADLQEQHPHPFLGLLLQHRDATKLRQIVDTLDAAVVDGRIHTRYEQTGTSTGRVSSTDPNLQNIPVKTAVGRRIRSAFAVAEPYTTLADRRLLADRDADHGAPLRRPRAHPGLQRGRGPAPLRRRPGVRRRAGRRLRRDAHEGQGDVLRPGLRAERVRPVEAAAHRAVRGPHPDDRVLRPLRRGARLPPQRRRAGARGRLHRDDLRSPSPVPRPEEPEPGPA